MAQKFLKICSACVHVALMQFVLDLHEQSKEFFLYNNDAFLIKRLHN